MGDARRWFGRGLVALLVAAALTLLATWWRRETPPPAAHEVAAMLQWRPGTTQHYRLAVLSTVRMHTAAQAVEAPLQHDVRGLLTSETLALAAHGATMRLQLDPVELQVGGVVDVEASLQLATPFEVRFDPAGMPSAFLFPPALAAEYEQQLEQLVRTFQLDLRPERRWRSEESHATGTYIADYERETPRRIRRTKLGYRDAAEAAVEVRSSVATVQIDPAVDWLAGMAVSERLATTTGFGLAVEVATEAVLKPLSDAEWSAAEVRAVGAAVAARSTQAASSAARQASPMTGEPLAELEAQLGELLAGLDAAGDERATFVHRLRDLIRRDHRVAALLLVVLREQPELRDRTRADLILALELGGTDAAQTALCHLVADPGWSPRDRTRAVIALGGTATPSEATLTTLWTAARDRTSAAARDQANTAVLALGAVASRMDHVGDPVYANLRGGLLSAAWGAGDARERAVLVLALGNTGDTSLGEEVVPFLDDDAAGVRRAAAKSLGKFGGDAGAIELALRVAQEPSSAVRAAMAGALASCEAPPPMVVAQVRVAILTERDEVARLSLVRCLGRGVDADPASVDVLRQLLATDSSSRVRRAITELLARVDAAGAGVTHAAGRER